MKMSTKPMSSPGRAEKYPPPLMRFLRSNVGSRSRGRSRSSPMFVLRKKTSAIETQEPTSPKVTCMGQVRVRRSKQPGKRNGVPYKRRCRWLNMKPGLCHCFNGTPKVRSFRPDWRKWVRMFRVGLFWKTKIRKDYSVKEESKINSTNNDNNRTDEFVRNDDEDGDDVEEEEEEAKVFVSSSSTPPKNAFLLTRCRSAPYRSSSLASRFWGSPLRNEDDDEEEAEHEELEPRRRRRTDPTSGRESNCRDSDQDSRTDPETEEKQGFFNDKINGKFMKSELKTEEEQLTTVRPMILTRCKSEPARTGQRLDPDLYFWKKRRLGFT